MIPRRGQVWLVKTKQKGCRRYKRVVVDDLLRVEPYPWLDDHRRDRYWMAVKIRTEGSWSANGVRTLNVRSFLQIAMPG